MSNYDLRQYPTETINMFKIVAFYIVDRHYNYIYKFAIQKQSETNKSITDEYKASVALNLRAFKINDNHYTRTLKGMNSTYQTFTKFDSINLANFIDKFLLSFIPMEYFEMLTDKQKNDFMISILVNIFTKFARVLMEFSMLKNVIDDHQNKEHFKTLTRHAIDIQIEEREITSKKLLDSITSDSETVPIVVVEKMRESIKTLAREKIQAINEIKRQKQINKKLLMLIRKIQLEVQKNKERSVFRIETEPIEIEPVVDSDAPIPIKDIVTDSGYVPDNEEVFETEDIFGKDDDTNNTNNTNTINDNDTNNIDNNTDNTNTIDDNTNTIDNNTNTIDNNTNTINDNDGNLNNHEDLSHLIMNPDVEKPEPEIITAPTINMEDVLNDLDDYDNEN